MTEELKPCPLCKSPAIRMAEAPIGYTAWRIECSGAVCGIRTAAYPRYAAASDVWNTRPSSPEAVLREALEEYLAEHDEEDWCQRIKYGKCSMLKCLRPQGAPPYDIEKATCPRWRLERARAALAQTEGEEG